ncbi:arginine N-succinyltransferase [Marinobacter sp. CHS3-4]|uniref:arginine N-succinyltransferase n=1 Tax=Marinobacter sp. CHS3-4 TaxID=3045174 RepID=UPI0024B5F98A|nr:arginine N-succinyltransferase [Marinobacter sp. CHS3-4]MDI9244763.1 arginine N-succinyltransferase [Marinobacter sp. CHS3-4]
MIIRPVAMKDLPDLKAIAIESGPGFTSLANDHDFLVQKIERSIASFANDVRHAGDQSYLFVLVDPVEGHIMGTTGIEASVGTRRPLYHYRVGDAVKQSRQLGLTRRQQTLTLGTHYAGCSEICTLFLRPDYRRAWAGKLLSRVRFLFMAQHPERFADTVIAEMRGVCDDAGQSPFWRWLQAHFIDLDFATVSQMVGTGDNGFIADLMPEHPLYTHLMDKDAQAVIGEVHPQTRPALHMLKSEGFRFNGYIDPFDGGPTVEARLSDIRSVNQSNRCQVHIRPDSIEDTGSTNSAWTKGGQGKTLMVANTKTDGFRATVTQAARYLPAHQMLEVPASVAQHLGLSSGAEVWFSDLEKQRNSNPFFADAQTTTPLLEANRAH